MKPSFAQFLIVKLTIKRLLNYLNIKKKSIRSWSISTKIKEADYAIKIGRMWSKKLGAICLIAGLDQKADRIG